MGKRIIWKDIKGYEGLYKISNTGIVLSLIKNKELKPYCLNKKSYPYVTLYKNEKSIKHTLHTLLAEHFIPKPVLEVNHKNGNKQDFKLENLEWGTRRDNMLHAYAQKLRKPNSRKTSKYKGVGYNKAKNKWRAFTIINNHYKHLGYFDTEKEAYSKYCEVMKGVNNAKS